MPLNDQQKLVFRSLADNKSLFEALQEFMLSKFDWTTVDQSMPNELLGAVARAKYEGAKQIENAFNEIASCKTREVAAEGVNPAR